MCQIAFPVLALTHNGSVDLQGVDEPENRYKERVDQEHNRLFLNDAVVFAKEVVKSDVLNQDSEHCSRQEQSYCVFDGEVVLFLGVGGVLFEVGNKMEEL